MAKGKFEDFTAELMSEAGMATSIEHTAAANGAIAGWKNINIFAGNGAVKVVPCSIRWFTMFSGAIKYIKY